VENLPINSERGLKGCRKTGELTGASYRPSTKKQRNNRLLAVISKDIELLAELARILDAWETEFSRAAEESQVRKIEEN
jgi:hypothetical protein